YFAILLILVMCTNTYAIPDAVLRVTPDIYPSIYTKKLFSSLKAIDVISILVFFSSLISVNKFLELKGVVIPFLVFILALVSTIVSVFYGEIDWGYFIFYIRGFIFIVGFFCLIVGFNKDKIIGMLYFSMFCWVVKMITMILFPSEHVIQREILGFQWKIFFAGDEYLYFGTISACILTLVNSQGSKSSSITRRKLFFYCAMAFFLALISQRKGAIPYFTLVAVMIFFHSSQNTIYRLFANSIAMLNIFVMFIAFLFIYPMLPSVYQLPFSEYYTLYVSAVDSISNIIYHNPYGALMGLGSMGLYEITSLPSYADHTFSFGAEVGNVYRYAIWNVPFGRLLINVGIIGFLMMFLFILYNLTANTSKFYLLISIVPFFGLYGVTPVSAIYVGFGLVVLYKSTHKDCFE
ncbi:MAG: hypothetical protein ACRCST_17825, partial [Turicibacter sp.]